MRPELKYTSESELESVFSTETPKQPKLTYVCSIPGCGQSFMRNVHLDRHEFKHTGVRKHACFHEGCDKSYTIVTHLKRHLKVFHEKIETIKDIPCSFEFCDKKFASNYSLQRHIREVHENPKVYKCSHCAEKFTQKLKLRRHEVKHTGVRPYKCSKCTKEFLLEHFLTSHVCKAYTCDQCKKIFKKWSELVAHRKEHKTIHKCDSCSSQFKTGYDLKEHKKIHDEDREVFQCTHDGCHLFYTKKCNLLAHIRRVHEGEKFKCLWKNCGENLSTKKSLENHINAIHLKTPTKPKTSKNSRARRKDAGKRKQSTLSKLSGVIIDKEVDKMIVEGTARVDIDLETLEKEMARGTDDEDFDVPAPVLVVDKND